jgi:DNA-binding MarR family transcriptional regulator
MDYEKISAELFYNLVSLPKGKGKFTPLASKVSHGEIRAMGYLMEKGGKSTSGEMAEGIGLSTGRTSLILASLERKGYISRSHSPSDKRVVYVVFSEKGRSFLQSISKKAIDQGAYLLEAIGEKDTQAFYDLMMSLYARKDEIIRHFIEIFMKNEGKSE